MIYLAEQEKIKNYIVEKNLNFIKNIKYFVHGFSVYSLEKILPSDIPIIIVDGQLSNLEAAKLKKVKNKSCIIVLDAGLRQICDTGIEPDFFVVGEFSGRKDIIENEVLNSIPMITCASVKPDILHCHKGPKYFYWTGNDLERELYTRGKKSSAYIYRYNELMKLSESNDLRIISMELALHMGASDIFLMGDGFDNFVVTEDVYDKRKDLTVHNCNRCSLSLIEKKCQVKYSLASIIFKIIPFFDKCGKKVLWEQVYMIRDQLMNIAKLSKKSIESYHVLYELIKQNNVIKDELTTIIDKLNEITIKIEENDIIKCVLTISENMESEVKIEAELTDRNSLNELAATVVDGMEAYEKVQIISEELSTLLTDIDCGTAPIIAKTESVPAIVPSILICCPISQYGVLPNFAQELKKGFQKLQYNTYFEKYSDQYQNTVGYDYILLMNGVHMGCVYQDAVLSQYKYAFDHKHTQRIALFVDHPIMHTGRLEYARNYVKVVFADRNWQKHVLDYWQQIRYVSFLPLGGIEQNEIVPFDLKEKKIVFFGSCTKLGELENVINTNKNSNLIWTIIDYLKKHVEKTIEEAIDDIGTERNCLYTLENMLLRTDIFMYIDEYIRQYTRQQVIWKIAESGLPIDLYGWKDDNIKMYSNVKTMDEVPMGQMLEICRHTRFVLNIQPWTKDGTQERVFNTMLGGSLAVTDVSKYLLEECEDQKHLLFYKLDDLETLVDKLTYYISNEPEAAIIAENGFQLAKEKHTWVHRAKEIAEMLGMPTDK